jgi:alkylhydroperoxidase family enzyme
MTRMRYLTAEDLPDEHRALIARNPGNLFRVLCHSPEGARQFARMGAWIRSRSGVDARVREMAILQVGYVSRSPYEWSHHVKIGREHGVSDEDVHAIVEETLNEVLASLGERDTMELVLAIAYYNLVVRVLATLDVDVEESYRSYLGEFPLPEA